MNKHVNKNKPVKVRADYGDTPVIVVDSSIPDELHPPSLRERIAKAGTFEELRVIEAEIEKVHDAGRMSEKTYRRCGEAAERRFAQFGPK